MKNHLILLLAVILISTSAKSQQIDTNYYENIISNIFGIQCNQISLLEIKSNEHTLTRFEDASQIGLESGLILSTGLASNIFSTNTGSSESWDSGLAGDTTLGQFITGSTYNSTSFTFSFSPSVSDSVSFNYVFASEEYPEFAPPNSSGFNDAFLFLISENGGPFENIALLPNGDDVNISNVNPITNNEYFIENQINSSLDFIFDGYTTPLTASFFAQAGSNYIIKIVITDVGDAIYDSAILLEEQKSYTNLSGNLNVNGGAGFGVIEIFQKYVGEYTLPYKSIDVDNGQFEIDSLPNGVYNARFVPNQMTHPNVPPTYFLNGIDWESATDLHLPCYLDNVNVNANNLPILGGNSSVSGLILIDSTFLKTSNIPFNGGIVQLFNSSNNFIGFSFSDEDGNYTISNLLPGSYYLVMDVPYLVERDTIDFYISTNQHLDGADFIVQENNIIANTTLNIDEISENKTTSLQVYPNPANSNLTIHSKTNQGIEIYSMSGKLVASYSLTNGDNSIDVSNLVSGIYFVKSEVGKPIKLLVNNH